MKIKLILTVKLPSYCIAFKVLEGDTYAMGGKKSSSISRRCEPYKLQ